MESELEKFRRNKKLEENKKELKSSIRSYLDSASDRLCRALLPNQPPLKEEEDKSEGKPLVKSKSSITTPTASAEDDDDAEEEVSGDRRLRLISLTLMGLAWLLSYVAFIKIGFGAVYFTISLLGFIYFSMRTTHKRKRGEVSAYSVFNKDCQSIDGTLKSEHLEKQLLYR